MISEHAREVDTDIQIRQFLAVLQAEDKMTEEQKLMDPPLVRLETESTHTLLSILLHLSIENDEAIERECDIQKRLVRLCQTILERFDFDAPSSSDHSEKVVTTGRVVALTSDGNPVVMASISAEFNMYAALIVATLKALVLIPIQSFKMQLKPLFYSLTNLIACEYMPLEVQLALSEVFATRIGPLISGST